MKCDAFQANSPRVINPMEQVVIDQFLNLVRRVYEGSTARSEDDLTARMSRVFEGIGLHTVVNTRVSSGSRIRPDVLGYVSEQDAHLVLPAELVVESKKPEEIEGFPSLTDAMVGDHYWADKTYPYLRDNIARVRYFAFTTFTEFSIFAVTRGIRHALAIDFESGDGTCLDLRERIRREALSFKLYDTDQRGPTAAKGRVDWVSEHLEPDALTPLPLSVIRNSVVIKDSEGLEALAGRLAIFAAGSGDPASPDSGLFRSARRHVGGTYATLSEEVQRDLLLFAMSQHPSLDMEQATHLIRDNLRRSLDEFVASSIHSLLSRLFALKVIEDCYCVGIDPPLIEPGMWLFATDAYDPLDPEQIRAEVFRRIRSLRESTNPFVRGFAEYGFFFDWIEIYVDAVLFRSLVETFASHDFASIEGDLLGRFYELYAQQINKTRRRELGQYYTPLAVVQFMWRKAVDLIEERGETERLMVLDPAMGSATFLAEGARVLAGASIPRFWSRLTGFDISPQVLGIAHVNVYMAVLSRLDPEATGEVNNLRLYVTDTLDREYDSHLREVLTVLFDPAHRAFLEQRVVISTQAKREGSYRLVIGNPPYKNNSKLTLGQVAQRFPDLLRSSVEHGGAQRRNIRDDYARFVAAANYYYIENQGVICFILSESFATHRSYEQFRVEILKHFHIRMLVRLGSNIFPDVGYRTSFAIILLEKRHAVLHSAEDAEPIPYTDLRPLVAGTPASYLCTPRDPRLAHLRAISVGNANLTVTERHIPLSDSRYSFYPGGNAVARFNAPGSLPVYERNEDRLFLRKWPGIITAFDVLFKGTRGELEDRFSSLFELCRSPGLSEGERGRLLDEWGRAQGFDQPEIPRPRDLGAQIAEASPSRLDYNTHKIKRSFSSSMPEDARWYPPAGNVHYLYYEPTLKVPRNVNEGRDPGWGSMNQWRDSSSHRITPKLIYTTASRQRHGFAAFVVDDEWYVKLQGGTSQQFNYTGLEFGGVTGRTGEIPNNLTDSGIELYLGLRQAGAAPDALLHYIAGVWNSDLAAELLDAGTSTRPRIKVPVNDVEWSFVSEIAANSRRARDFARLIHHLPDGKAEIPVELLEPWADAELLADLGILRVTEERHRFRPREFYRPPFNSSALARERLTTLELQINNLVESLYS